MRPGRHQQSLRRSLAAKRNWASPAFRAKQARARKRAWADPTTRANHISALRSEEARAKAAETARMKWRDPEIRGRVVAGMRLWWGSLAGAAERKRRRAKASKRHAASWIKLVNGEGRGTR
jgi:hypothetical protein